MADNVRDVIRAAQQAEIGGDKRRAIELFQRAAELCRRAGNTARAGQLLRYALRLEPSRADLREALDRLEESEARAAPSPAVPPEEDDELGPEGTWEVEEDGSSLLDALREAELAVDRRSNPVELAVKAMRSAVLGAPGAKSEEPPSRAPPEGEGRFIERGPTRADPSLDAWCSFCCRPRTEVGPLVAGPAGAFICAACIGESGGLLGGVAPRPPSSTRPRGSARRSDAAELLGQLAAREELARGLASGVHRVLLLGPEGSGKSTWLRELARQGRGELVTFDSLERASVESVLLLEDVDRLPPAEQSSLGAFLERHPRRTVLMSSRGGLVARGPELFSDTGRLIVPTTAALVEATRGALPLALLERVQLLVPLEMPGVELLREIARRELEAREDCHLSDEALTALAQEAARSPRLGHELRALLARLPPGSWRVGKGTP
ncbi:ClpX C4-type zinc finger protein [Melittangium boletus]|uniref:Tetratricopeptide repeat/ClpX C4-type zinc finger protein n=1 Tax=Melittangium boletus DSM 14713 TaxID=1294270 RepID=A0A250ILS9_9BACT|nr:ClpX C4-type zinc finger protein [Melittangium boletus]ATB32715.1 tetratricopeptide repeat/ClpX C4-type zinc finger protein [Melittangium boletus DSM 14713]